MTVGNFAPFLGSTGNDSVQANNLDIVYGLAGDDDLTTNADFSVDDAAIFVGGSGSDRYVVEEGRNVIISDNGLSDDEDTIVANSIDGNSGFVTVDSRHLYLFDESSDTSVLVLDYRDSENQIEFFEQAGGTISYEEVIAQIDGETPVPDFTFEQLQSDPDFASNFASLGLSVDTIDADIQEIQDTSTNFEENIETTADGSQPNILTDTGNLEDSDLSYTSNGQEYFYDLYSLDSETYVEGDTVEITLSSSEFNPSIFLLDSKGNVLEFEDDTDDASTDFFTALSFTVPDNEPLFISVEGSNADAVGFYGLSFTRNGTDSDTDTEETETVPEETIPDNTDATLSPIETTDSIAGSLATDDEQITVDAGDIFYTDGFTLPEGTSGEVQITLESDFDGIVFVDETNEAGESTVLLDVDEDIEGGTEQGKFTTSADNTYRIFVDTVEPETTGDYTLTTEVVESNNALGEKIVQEEIIPDMDSDTAPDFSLIQTTDSLTGAISPDDVPVDGETGLFYNDIFFFDGDTPGEVQISLESDFDGILFIIEDGESGEPVTRLEVDDFLAGGVEEGTFAFEPGNDPAIFVSTFDPEATGNYTLTTEFLG